MNGPRSKQIIISSLAFYDLAWLHVELCGTYIVRGDTLYFHLQPTNVHYKSAKVKIFFLTTSIFPRLKLLLSICRSVAETLFLLFQVFKVALISTCNVVLICHKN